MALYGRTACAEVRTGPGWFAVRTGIDSNDLNGVVSTEVAVASSALVADLQSWFGSTPASWLTAEESPRLSEILVAAGARPERSGSWSGRPVPLRRHTRRVDVEIVRVREEAQLDSWLAVAERCGWIEGDEDRAARRGLYCDVGLDHSGLSHWLALEQGQPVGFATSHLEDGVVDLCNLAVLDSHRRRGIGSSLVRARLADAQAHGVRTAVSAPSPDGWRLQKALGFVSVPVRPDRCFYLPGKPAARPGSA